MAFTITSQPAALSFCGNLPDFVLESDAAVSFKLYDGAELVLEELYWPDAAGEIRVDLEDVIDGLLTLQVPELDVPVYHQASGCKQFKAKFDTTEILFTVVKGGVDASITAADFLAAHFLTWQPQVKPVGLGDPQWLTYYAAAECKLRARAYFLESILQESDVVTLEAGMISTINVKYSVLAGLFSAIPYTIDLWIEAEGIVLTYVQRLQLQLLENEYKDLFIFENSVGGIDTIEFFGEKERNDNFKFSRGLFDDTTRDYLVEPDQAYTKDTGFFSSENHRTWSLEFFKSLQKYFYSNGLLREVILPKQTLDSVGGELSGFSFEFSLSKQTKYLSVTREDLPEVINDYTTNPAQPNPNPGSEPAVLDKWIVFVDSYAEMIAHAEGKSGSLLYEIAADEENAGGAPTSYNYKNGKFTINLPAEIQ